MTDSDTVRVQYCPPCHICGGTGHIKWGIGSDPCIACSGTGRIGGLNVRWTDRYVREVEGRPNHDGMNERLL